MTPNKIISHFHNYLCILIVLKKVTSICNIGTEVQKIFSKSNIIYKMFILQVTKKKKGKVQYSDVGPQYYKRCCIIHVLAAI